MNKKLLNTIIIVLLLVNLGTLAALWMKSGHSGPPPPPHGGPHGGPIEMFLKEDLKFSDDQMTEFRDTRIRHRQTMEPLHHAGRKLREQMFQLIGQAGGEPQADSLATLIGQNVMALENATYDNFNIIRALCNEEQKPAFDQLILEILKRGQPGAGGPPPPGRPGHPGHR
jgi:hypothetical protein